ncbi:MAG: molybdopterin-dependent oxidoreductase [Phycisphaeraceae bacterium]|nr:molybdopterin-dependent oxidoreductase [Phycisphaeraceae bacterium]
MPSITIDGRQCNYEGKKMILQVAQENGVEIPHYCYHPGLSIVASCRICLAEVAQPNPRNGNKLELIPKLMPTCQTPVADGMVVYTRSPKAIANQKAVMEYLLINHPLDCPVCDQAGECHLQDYSYKYGRAESRFVDDKIKQPKKDIGPHVLLYADRCIMCSRCVRFTKEVSGTAELGVFGRGNREQIDVFPGRPLNNELSGNVVDICPVGALLDKDFLFTQRVWFLKATPSIDGVTASGDHIRIDHNDGLVYRIKPRTNADGNKWWISDEIRYGWKFVHAQERLRVPQRQQLGGMVECDWKTAYREALAGLRKAVKEKGPGSLAVMVSPMLASEEAYLLGKAVRALDEQAILAVGPVPVVGEDKTFPGGYTIYAEKSPNARGVRQALELVGGGAESVLDFPVFIKSLEDKQSKTAAMILTGGYPTPAGESKELVKAVGKRFMVTLDVLPNALASKANVLLPGATWVEKSGSFVNVKGKTQGFMQAIGVLEGARTEGQIALDLLAEMGASEPERYDVATVRERMGGMWVSGVAMPSAAESAVRAEMSYVEL